MISRRPLGHNIPGKGVKVTKKMVSKDTHRKQNPAGGARLACRTETPLSTS